MQFYECKHVFIRHTKISRKGVLVVGSVVHGGVGTGSRRGHGIDARRFDWSNGRHMNRKRERTL